MVDLIYPADYEAPVLPEITAATTEFARTLPLGEMLPVIREDGIVVGRATRQYCHSGSKLLHPVVHLHLIDHNECIYLQKRSLKKDLLPGMWDTAVGGHVSFGEGIRDALMRESFEELSLSDFTPIFLEAYRWDTQRDAEFVSVFATVGNPSPKPDLDEVEQGRWWPVKEIDANLDKGVFTPNFEFEYLRIKSDLLALL